MLPAIALSLVLVVVLESSSTSNASLTNASFVEVDLLDADELAEWFESLDSGNGECECALSATICINALERSNGALLLLFHFGNTIVFKYFLRVGEPGECWCC